MTPEEVAAWWAANRSVRNTVLEARSPCHDCSRIFADTMRLVGRCNGRFPGEIVGPVGDLVKLRNGYWGYSNPEDRLVARRASWRRSTGRRRMAT